MATKLIHKTTLADSIDDGVDGIFSDMSVDSYDDVVGDPDEPKTGGWDYENFATKNPVGLFNHQKESPVARVTNVRWENGALRGRIILAPRGSSRMVDETRALIAAGVLRGISVGFVPILSKPRKSGGTHFLRQKLLEVSIVALPACSSALLQQAKSLGVSTTTIRELFKQSQNASIGDRISAARYTVKERQEIHRRALAMVARIPRRPTPEEKADQEAFAKAAQVEADKKAYRQAVHRKAKAMVAGWEQERRLEKARVLLSKQDPPPYESSDTYITWRGQRIRVPEWRGKKIW